MSRARNVLLAGALVACGYACTRDRIRRYEIVERSMEPALRPGDYVVARRTADIERGAVVIFDHPGRTGFELVKRVIGLPGETVEVRNGRVHIGGKPLAEPWASQPTRPDGEWRLGPAEVFVLGDNRAASAADGRTIGGVDRDALRWRITARYWPPGNIGVAR